MIRFIRNYLILTAFLTVVLSLGYHSAAVSNPAPGRSIVDMAGRTVILPEKINSIGTLGSVGVLNAFVEAMGEGSKIINRLPTAFENDRWRLQLQFAPQIKNGPLFEGVNRELLNENIILAKPDVCLVMSKELAEQLDKLNVPNVYLEWKDVLDIHKTIHLLGQVLNKPEAAQRYIEYFNQRLSLAQSLTARLNEKEKPRVLYGNPLQFSQPHQIANWWIEQAGGHSVTGKSFISGSLQYNMEDLLLWDPEVMILINQADAERIKTHSNFKDISAVKNNAFHFIPTVAHTWGNRTVEQPLTVLWALHKLHPGLLPRDKLAEEIQYFYSTFFLYELSPSQINTIIGGQDID
jgi:iron complex transport system substrate-binding protein